MTIEPNKMKEIYLNAIEKTHKNSYDAVRSIEEKEIDFVFIDAAHDYESVKKDILAWLPKVKKTGIIAGHDYTWCQDVKKAVHECFPDQQIYETEGCWIYTFGQTL